MILGVFDLYLMDCAIRPSRLTSIKNTNTNLHSIRILFHPLFPVPLFWFNCF